MGLFPRWLNRQCIAFSMLIFMVVFLIVSLSLPWYGIVETNAPWPPETAANVTNQAASIVSVFYWTGYSSAIDPNYTAALTQHKAWAEFAISSPKDIYMACMAMCLLALFTSVGLGFLILIGEIINESRRWMDLVCCGKTKWVVFAVSTIVVAFIFLAWVVFFGFTKALADEGSLCPDERYVGYGNRMWCETFFGTNITGSLHSQYTWAPSVGWIFAVMSMVWALGVSFFLFIVKPKTYYEQVGDNDDYRR
jgi:hypothetical protein